MPYSSYLHIQAKGRQCLRLPFKNAIFDTPLRSSLASQRELSRHTTKLVGDSSRSSQSASTMTSKATSDNLREAWTYNVTDIYETSRIQYTEDRWSGWPESSLQNSFLESFVKFQDLGHRRTSPRVLTSANEVLRGFKADRKLESFLAGFSPV
jgi:hypothetical protein